MALPYCKTGRSSGGDGTYYYTGEYEFKGRTFQATLRIYPFIEGAESVFKTVGQDLTLELEGSITDDGRIVAQGHPSDMPNLNFGVKLTKRR